MSDALFPMPTTFGKGGDGLSDGTLRKILSQLRGLKVLTGASAASAEIEDQGVKATATLSDGTNNTLRLDGRLRGEHGNRIWYETLRRTVNGVALFDLTIRGPNQADAGTAFTAATSDVCTATAHGFVTGAGPIRLSNSGGALPAGLAATALYWVIRIDANTFKLATTKANAIAGTAVDITGTGTGTHSFHTMATPEVFQAVSMLNAHPQFVETAVSVGLAGQAKSEWVRAVDLNSAAGESRPVNTTVPVVLASGAGEGALTGVVRGDVIAAIYNVTGHAMIAPADIDVTDTNKIVCNSANGVDASQNLVFFVFPKTA